MKRWIAVLCSFALPVSLWAGKVKTVTWSQATHYDKANLQHTVVSSDGRVRLAQNLRPFPTKQPIDAARIWDIAEDQQGHLFFATGDNGKILRVTPEGQVQVAYETKESQVLCILALPDGGVVAGTGPNGLLIHINAAGQGRVLFDSPARYIWALVWDERSRSLYAATGSPARIYRVPLNGESELYFECGQDHILALTMGADGTLYAGADGRGLVYRIPERHKGSVLFQTAQSEVRCLFWTPGGLYVGTSSPGRTPRATSGSSSSPTGVSSRPHTTPATPVAQATPAPTPLADTSNRDRSNPPERFTAAAPDQPTVGENSVYRIGFDGTVRELYRDKGLILSLLVRQDRLLIGTASKGQLIEIEEATRAKREIARADGGQVYRLVPRRDGRVLIAVSDPGRVFELSEEYVTKGTLLGEVIDAKLASRWGSLSWRADTPAGTRLSVSVRGGNVSDPDETWTPWSEEMTNPSTAAAQLPPVRFLQVRVTLSTQNPLVSPTLHHFTIRYASVNQPPEVTSLETPNPDAVALSKDPKRLRFKWTATDANEDDLVFDLFVRRSTWDDWVRIEEGWAKNEYEWDTTTMPSGEYRFKVVASDRPDNNEGSALWGSRISDPVIVSHESPTVKITATRNVDGRIQVDATANCSTGRLFAAAYAIDGGKWNAVQPEDGLFDACQEVFKFQTERLPVGPHVIVLRVRDIAGNWGMADLVVNVPGPAAAAPK